MEDESRPLLLPPNHEGRGIVLEHKSQAAAFEIGFYKARQKV